MPHYYFTCADSRCVPEGGGVELPNDLAAQRMAITFTGEMLKDDPQCLSRKGSWCVEVTNEAGDLLCKIVTIALQPPRPADGVAIR